MSDALATLIDLDLSAELAALPRMPGFVTQAARGPETHTTLHYSGVPGARYADRSRGAELARIVAEAREHLTRDWSRTGRGRIYGDGYQYDLVVLSDGAIARTRGRRQQLWHCGNGDGNERSWSVHVLLGTGQDLTAPQRASLFRLFDALRGAHPRASVVGHHEWPRGEGRPQPSARYRTLFGQSECPGPILHAHLAAYRALQDAPAAPAYTEHSPILGPARVTARQLTAAILAQPHGDYSAADVALIVGEYARCCALLGIDLGIAGAQLIHETGHLGSWWAQRPRRNPAGLGVTGDARTGARPGPHWAFDAGHGVWSEGLSFSAWRDADAPDGEGGISHHLGRLLAYALPAGAGTDPQQRAISRALGRRPLAPLGRGSAPTLKPLGALHNPANAGRARADWVAGWAWDGAAYGARLAIIADSLRRLAP